MSRPFEAFWLPRGVERPPSGRAGLVVGAHPRPGSASAGERPGGGSVSGPAVPRPPAGAAPGTARVGAVPGTPHARAPGRTTGEPVEIRYAEWDVDWLAGLAGILRSRAAALSGRSTASIVDALGRTGARFLDRGDPVRTEALELLPATSGLSAPMAEAVLDGMAAGWRREELEALLVSELGPVDRSEPGREDTVIPVGPRLCVQIVSGSVPGVGATALVRSLLVKGPTLLKPGRGDVVLPVLFARALAEVDPELADASAVLYWPGGSTHLEAAAVARADVVVAYGSDEAVRTIRDLTPVATRFVPYHHRTSVGVVGAGGVAEHAIERTAEDVARAVALFDQRGCVSPQIVWVEDDGTGAAPRFARRLAGALDTLEERLPGGTLDVEEASALQQLRGAAEMMAAAGSPLEVLHGAGRSWTVVLEPEPVSLPACVGRVVRVRPLASLDDLPRVLEPLADHLQTVGIAGVEHPEALAAVLGRAGASRVARFGAVPFPPASWHHDGGRPLGDLVRWVDLERG